MDRSKKGGYLSEHFTIRKRCSVFVSRPPPGSGKVGRRGAAGRGILFHRAGEMERGPPEGGAFFTKTRLRGHRGGCLGTLLGRGLMENAEKDGCSVGEKRNSDLEARGTVGEVLYRSQKDALGGREAGGGP